MSPELSIPSIRDPISKRGGLAIYDFVGCTWPHEGTLRVCNSHVQGLNLVREEQKPPRSKKTPLDTEKEILWTLKPVRKNPLRTKNPP